MSQYYDGTKLLSMLDINGKKPEIYMTTTNRTGGKTTYFGRLLVNRFKKTGAKFCLLYRFNYELDEVADKFFKDIGGLFFPDDDMTEKTRQKGKYKELFLNDVSCGYAIAINDADSIKKLSHLFSDTSAMFFDEFQSETNKYAPDEIKKLISIHTSLARGQNKQVRYLPIYMCANTVSLINPYYVELGITGRLKADTNFLKGDGFVLEQGFVEAASTAQKESGFNRAFAQNDYVAYASECVYLNDSSAFIDTPKGRSNYIATLRSGNKKFAIREYLDEGVVYCDKRIDDSFPIKITVSANDHDVNYVMLKRSDLFLSTMRYYFERGCFRFKDIECKEIVLKALSY